MTVTNLYLLALGVAVGAATVAAGLFFTSHPHMPSCQTPIIFPAVTR